MVLMRAPLRFDGGAAGGIGYIIHIGFYHRLARQVDPLKLDTGVWRGGLQHHVHDLAGMDAYAAKPDFGSQRMLKIGCSVAVRLHAAKVKNNVLLSRCEIDHRKVYGGIAKSWRGIQKDLPI
jgi:hypothetical protein